MAGTANADRNESAPLTPAERAVIASTTSTMPPLTTALVEQLRVILRGGE
jgi:hypothetical protein